jgi:hypothetical protein
VFVVFFLSSFNLVVVMAVQAQLYPERLGLLPMGGQQDCILDDHVSEFDADWGFAFQEPQQQNLFLDQNNSQNFCFDCNIGASSSSSSYSTTCDSSFSMFLSQCLDVQLDMQRREVDCMLQLQVKMQLGFDILSPSQVWFLLSIGYFYSVGFGFGCFHFVFWSPKIKVNFSKTNAG